MTLTSTVSNLGRSGIGLTLRKVDHHLDLAYFLLPLFQYMRWAASRSPDEIYRIHVDPKEIDRIKLFPPQSVPVTGFDALRGAVGGPWDRLAISIRNHYIHQSIRGYLYDGLEWSETPIYEHPKYRDDPKKARRRCEKIEAILDSIQANGYHSEPEFTAPDESHEWIGDVRVGDEIVVGLGRTGELIHLKNGRHRLAAAQLLDVDRIPVVLSIYHPSAAGVIPVDADAL